MGVFMNVVVVSYHTALEAFLWVSDLSPLSTKTNINFPIFHSIRTYRYWANMKPRWYHGFNYSIYDEKNKKNFIIILLLQLIIVIKSVVT